jgi:hypothetical protein
VFFDLFSNHLLHGPCLLSSVKKYGISNKTSRFVDMVSPHHLLKIHSKATWLGLTGKGKDFLLLLFYTSCTTLCMKSVYDAVDFIHIMQICHSPVNLYYAVSVCSVFLVRELSCPSMNLTSSHGSLNLQFSHKPPYMLQPYTSTCHWSGIVSCILFSVVIFCMVWFEQEQKKIERRMHHSFSGSLWNRS